MDILNTILILSAFLFSIGFIIVVTKKNAIFVLMGIELMLNAANLNFVTFGSVNNDSAGHFFGLFILVLAAAEAAVGLAIVLKIYQFYKSSDIEDANELKG